MAINPEKTQNPVFKFSKQAWLDNEEKEHYVCREDHVEPWKGWANKNDLEPTWLTMPQGKRGEHPFKVEEGAVGSGTGEKRLRWRVWDKPSKLETVEVEHYAVMRAEHHFIKQGYTKVASKYVNLQGRDNCGVDSFFVKNGNYVFCESKFTGDLKRFEDLKNNREKVWSIMSHPHKTMNGKSCRQMSWDWIEDRLRRAIRYPSSREDLSSTQADANIERLHNGSEAAGNRRGKRFVNIFGASKVPMYPGAYRLYSVAGASSNMLEIVWPIKYNPKEFIRLGRDFSIWLKHRKK